jgi:hypothetical protein
VIFTDTNLKGAHTIGIERLEDDRGERCVKGIRGAQA